MFHSLFGRLVLVSPFFSWLINAQAPLFEESQSAKADRVANLPFYGTPPSPQYSGFLDASASTDGTFLHYWMASYEGDLKLQFWQKEADFDESFDPEADFLAHEEEKERKKDRKKRHLHEEIALAPEDIPVLFWFNGGPGSSSLLGFLTELGPLIVKEDGDGFLRNPFSWTRKAHVVALESPAGVGYSYCKNSTLPEPGMCNNSDKSTASDARAAVEDFFATKFPDLKKNPVFLAGESYAGVYIPTLAKELLDSAPEINLKGLAVGDPCTDNEAQQQAFDMLWYSHKYGFVPDDTFDLLYHQCRVRIPHPITLGEYHGDPGKMQKVIERRQERLEKEQMEHRFNLITDSALKNNKNRRLLKRQLYAKYTTPENAKQQEERENAIKAKIQEDYEAWAEEELHERLVEFEKVCSLEHRKFMLQTSMEISQEWTGKFVNPYALYEPVDTKYYQRGLVGYMNRLDVRSALHMDSAPAPRWYDDTPYTDTKWTYRSDYNACNDNEDLDPNAWSMVDFYRDVAPRLDKTIVFNGDSDPCVTYEGTRRAILGKVGFDVIPGGSYRPWFFHQLGVSTQILEDRPLLFGSSLSVHDAGTQFGGHVINLENNLSFVTVHGSGHMVPSFRPQAALQILDELLHDRPMSPLLETDESIMNMSKHNFHKYVGNWTQAARDAI